VLIYYGAGFERAVTPLLLLLPGALGFAIARPIYAIGQGKGNLRALIAATGTAALVNILLNLLLIPTYGTTGAAIATSVGYGSMLVFHGLAALRIGYNPFADLRLPQVAASVAVTTPVVLGLTRFLGFAPISLVVVPPVGFIVYTVAALKTGAVTSEDIVPVLEYAPDWLAQRLLKTVRWVE
jgi:O-antigen/teichoic acid export membrane protein